MSKTDSCQCGGNLLAKLRSILITLIGDATSNCKKVEILNRNSPPLPKAPLHKKSPNAPPSPSPLSMSIPFSLSAKWKWKQLWLGGGGRGCTDLNNTRVQTNVWLSTVSVSTLFAIACSLVDVRFVVDGKLFNFQS